MKNKAAQELGRLGGIVKSDKKAKSSRENGKRGGRPTVVCLCGYDPKHPEVPRMDIVCPKHD